MKKIYLDELGDKCSELISYSKNDIAAEIAVLKDLPNKLNWKGLSKDTYVSYYNKKIEKLVLLNENICKIAEFLSNVQEDYNNANSQINNAYDELLSSFEKIRNI